MLVKLRVSDNHCTCLSKFAGCDVNARNCLGCTALLYACGSGHVETVRALLAHPEIDVNRRNNDRLTSFMLAMQVAASLNKEGEK